MIKGGYILQPRIIQESDIYISPPYVREIWSYLLREANHKDAKYSGHLIKRGQLFRSYQDIIEGTKWFIGWRKMTYHENHTKKAMKFLRDTGRISTRKELGGVLITILKYDYYQDKKNYESTKEETMETPKIELMENQPIPDNNNNDKNNNNDNNDNIFSRKEKFKNEIWKFEDEFEDDHLNQFFEYWTEETHDKTMMRFENEEYWNTQSRLSRFKPSIEN
jgi:hypothetical protein